MYFHRRDVLYGPLYIEQTFSRLQIPNSELRAIEDGLQFTTLWPANGPKSPIKSKKQNGMKLVYLLG